MKKFRMLGALAVFSLVFGVGMLATGCGEAAVELTFHEAVAATCETAGNVAYYEDEATGKFYSDAEGKNELTSVVIEALGHDYVRSAYLASGYSTSETAGYYYICSRDNLHFHIDDSVTVSAVSDVTGLTTAFSNAANGTNAVTIVLTDDVSYSSEAGESLSVTTDVILDLNGKKLTFSVKNDSDNYVYSAIQANGNDAILTIDDGVGTGEFVHLVGYGIFSLNGGTAVVNGGTFTTLSACLSSNNLDGIGNFTITGGTFNTLDGSASIYMPAYGELKISGGTFNSGLFLRMGDVEITGGTFYSFSTSRNIANGLVEESYYSSFAYDTIENEYKSSCIWFGNAISIYVGAYSFSNNNNSLNLRITGGIFINDNNDTVEGTTANNTIQVFVAGKVAQTTQITVTGGQLSSEHGSVYNSVISSADTFGSETYYNESNNNNSVAVSDVNGLLTTAA